MKELYRTIDIQVPVHLYIYNNIILGSIFHEIGTHKSIRVFRSVIKFTLKNSFLNIYVNFCTTRPYNK